MATDGATRINKHLAERGISTRIGADELIRKGLVFINGRRAVLGDKVGPGDEVEVRGSRPTYRYFAYHKPSGVITHSPQFGEKDIASATKLKGVFPVGRLDKRSSGLIILTDDARITDKLLNPAHEHEKEYLVTTKDVLPSDLKAKMERGVNIEGYVTKPAVVRVLSEKRFSITLTEGKKHQIRRMCAALGVDVAKLERVRVMNVRLAGLKPGEHRSLEGEELKSLLSLLGVRS